MDPVLAAAGVISFAAGLVLLYALLVRAIGPRRRLESAMGRQALRARRARGEISADEFEQGKNLLGD